MKSVDVTKYYWESKARMQEKAKKRVKETRKLSVLQIQLIEESLNDNISPLVIARTVGVAPHVITNIQKKQKPQ
jgi:hypothetical protein